MDAKVDLKFRLRAELRAKILFGKWTRLARETVNVDMRATGKVKIKANLVVRDLRVVTEDNKLLVKFHLEADLKGRAHGWKIDHLDPGKCEIRVCRIKVGSYVRLAEKNLRKGIERHMDKWTSFQAPKLVEKLEAKMKKKIGQEIVIQVVDLSKL